MHFHTQHTHQEQAVHESQTEVRKSRGKVGRTWFCHQMCKALRREEAGKEEREHLVSIRWGIVMKHASARQEAWHPNTHKHTHHKASCVWAGRLLPNQEVPHTSHDLAVRSPDLYCEVTELALTWRLSVETAVFSLEVNTSCEHSHQC